MTIQQAVQSNEVSPYTIVGLRKCDSLKTITEAVNFVFGLEEGDINNPTRRREIVQARQLVQTLCRWVLNWGIHKIGLKVGKRDHATVLYSIRTTKALYQTDKIHRGHIDRVLVLINRTDLVDRLTSKEVY